MSDWTPSARELERRRVRQRVRVRSALIATAMTVVVFLVAGVVGFIAISILSAVFQVTSGLGGA